MAQLRQNEQTIAHSLIEPAQYLLQGEIHGTVNCKCLQISHQVPLKEDALQPL